MIGKASFAPVTVAALAALASTVAACAPRPRMCTATSECAQQTACVAGRCQPEKATVKAAVDSARRWVVAPTELAYVRRGSPASDGAIPPLFVLGRDRGVLFLKFSVALPPTANVVEAYVCLHRSGDVDDDPAPLALHATRIVDSWDGRSISWAFQPRVEEVRTPVTVVAPGGPALVRVDVRDLVRNWRKHDPRDQGVAIVAEGGGDRGTTFALLALGSDATGRGLEVPPSVTGGGRFDGFGGGDRGRPVPVVSAPDVAPYLELYVR